MATDQHPGLTYPYGYFHELAEIDGRAYLPFGHVTELPASASFTPFGFTGDPSAGDSSFELGWRLDVGSGEDLASLRAMFSGALWLQKVSADDYRLVLRVLDATLIAAFKHLRPEWFPFPDYVVYENVDPDSVADALRGWAADDATLVADTLGFLASVGREFADWDACVDSFVDVESTYASEFQVVVNAGASVGRAGVSPDDASAVRAGVRFCRATISGTWEEQVDDPLYLNPGWYVRDWPHLFVTPDDTDVSGHALWSSLIATTGWPWSNGGFRFVSQATGVSGLVRGVHGSGSARFDDLRSRRAR